MLSPSCQGALAVAFAAAAAVPCLGHIRRAAKNRDAGPSESSTPRQGTSASLCLSSRKLAECVESNTSSERAFRGPAGGGMRASSTPIRAQRVAYCTDVEGNLDYWERFIDLSEVLHRDKSTGEISMVEGAHFVYGGDSVDKGSGDLAFLKELVALRAKYPDRVHIILGNRDINKMRLPGELNPKHMMKYPFDGNYPGVYWRRQPFSSQTPPPTEILEVEDGSSADSVRRLKWILSQTMGSSTTFELRRKELSRKSENNSRHVSDEEVVQSFVDSLRPSGEMAAYLEAGQLACIIGDTLFVHGGLNDSVIGWLPPGYQLSAGEHSNGNTVEGHLPDALTWVFELNKFCAAELRAWLDDLQPGFGISSRGDGEIWAKEGGFAFPSTFAGGNLMAYGMGWNSDGSRNPTVVYRDWMLDESRLSAAMPKKQIVLPRGPSPRLVRYLNQSGIRRIVCGHKPHGDAALVIRSDPAIGNMDVITVDTSYSRNVHWFSGRENESAGSRFRGVAVSELLVEFDPEESGGTSTCNVHGILASGEEYDCVLGENMSPALAGCLLSLCDDEEPWIVKGRSKTDNRLLLSRLRGWDAENRWCSVATAEKGSHRFASAL